MIRTARADDVAALDARPEDRSLRGPLGYIVLGLVHPMGDLDVGDAAGFYIFLHVVQPLLIALIAYGLWLLVDGLESTAATVVRYGLVPYVILWLELRPREEPAAAVAGPVPS
jgi:hypothetical protein